MQRWLIGARPRTLPAAVVPVARRRRVRVGEGGIVWWRVGAALVVSLALQVGVNYANDYSDGVQGNRHRAGRSGAPRRVRHRQPAGGQAGRVRSPSASPLSSGLALAAATTWWLLAVGVACIAAAWGYTGGPSPYGYMGLGEVFVFVFFGLVATVGTTYVAVERVTALAVVAGCGVGCLACALLVVNNLRDIPTDTAAGKRTLGRAVRATRGRGAFFVGLVVGAFAFAVVAAIWRPPALLVLLADPRRGRAGPRSVVDRASGPALIGVLGATGRTQLAYGALFALGLALGG